MQDQLITILAITFFALIAAIIASRFKQPVLLGFLLVGAIIGPHTFNFVRDGGMINTIIEIGAALLLFMIGLEFNLEKLKGVGTKSIFIGVLKIGIIFFIGYHVFTLFLPMKEAVLLGIIISFSSTIIIIKILESRNMLVRQEIPTLIAILIIEDLIAVSLLTLLSGIAKGNGNLIPVLEHLFNSLFVLVLVYIVTLAILRPIFKNIIMKQSNESIIMFTSLSMILVFSYLAHVLGFSFALGAFLAGSLISSLSKTEMKGFHHAINPFSFLFSSLFFIAIGTLVDLSRIWDYKWILLAIIAVVIVTRLIAVGLLTYLFSSFRGEQTLFSSITMLSVGEFSLLIAKEGMLFGGSLDLVTITSVIIFFSAIIMSFTLNYSSSIKQEQSFLISTKIKIMASYIKKVFDSLDIENMYTDNFRKHVNIVSGFIIAFLVFLNLIVGFTDIVTLFPDRLIGSIIYYAVGAGILAFIGHYIVKELRKAHASLAVILANQSFTRNIARAKKIIKAFSISFLLIVIGLFFPLLIFLTGIPKAWGLISLLIVGIGLYILRDSVTHIDSSLRDNSYPKYEKFSHIHLKKYSMPQAAMRVDIKK
jgi:CPA2 family monovalent cation:H+ antiporter-2